MPLRSVYTSLVRRQARHPFTSSQVRVPILRWYAAGDTGSVRPGGARDSDAWSRREKAAEDLYIYEREKEIIKLLREKVARQEEILVSPPPAAGD